MAARPASWMRRHKVLTVLGVLLLIVVGSCDHAGKAPASHPASPATTTAAASPTPSRHHRRQHHHLHAISWPTTAPPSPAPVAATPACYPISDEGTCYQPGEFCRDSDHGTTGIAGDGETITCEDNDGWRWEPS